MVPSGMVFDPPAFRQGYITAFRYGWPMPYKDPEVQRRYMREWVAKRRSDWFADKKCVRCGTTDDLRVDHIDPTLKVSHRIWSWAIKRRDAELAKCQVLCHPCHVIKTVEGHENAHGERSNFAVMTDSQMIEALAMYATGNFTFRQVGDRFGVHRDTIRHAWTGRTWRHLQA